ncbi:DUF2306 domain-containing protein [uncultured Alsobacter sp.]|uniref:DUF2306 domain-containing protein n=1 Tax=uncultured Alsobacter sp. TaxID=1748258 RepID=UPI0025CD7AD2|nr:DUF2306 domain-containing protein [uncultured Alsobacter sp.]
MTLAPLLAATPVIQAHAYAALLAAGLSLHQFFARPGTLTHKALGYVWVAAMATAAASSFFIHSIRSVGPFSAIHLLSIFVLVNLTRAVLAARAGQITRHRKTMRGLALFGLLVAGLFTLLPGRIMHAVVFG